MAELRLDHPQGSLLRQVPPGDGKHLLCRRWLVRPLDGDVFVWELFALNRQAEYLRRLVEFGLARLAVLRPCEDGAVPARLVTVPDRRGVWGPVITRGDAKHADVPFGEELLTFMFGHPTGHASSSCPTSLLVQQMVGFRASIHKCLPEGALLLRRQPDRRG